MQRASFNYYLQILDGFRAIICGREDECIATLASQTKRLETNSLAFDADDLAVYLSEHRKDDFAKVSENLNTDLKIMLLDHQNNYNTVISFIDKL